MKRQILMLAIMLLSLVGLVTAQQADWSSTVVKLRKISGYSSHVSSIAFSPDGRMLTTASFDGLIYLWDVSSGQKTKTFIGNTDVIWSIKFSPDGRTLAAAASDKTIKLWDVSSGSMRTLVKLSDSILSIAFSPDGSTLAGASNDSTIKLWDVSTGQSMLEFKGHSGPVHSVVFSPDGYTLASASTDHTINLWDANSGKKLHTFMGHTDIVWSVAFSSDGHKLASASRDMTIKLWDVLHPQHLITLAGNQGVKAVVFSPDGRKIVSITERGGWMTLWDIQSEKELSLPFFEYSESCCIAFASDGRTFSSSASGGQSITLWGSDSKTPIFGASPEWLEKYGQTQTPKTGSLELRSNNEGAILTINGEAKGLTGASRSLDLPPGTYTVTVSASSFKPQTQTVTIESGKTANAVFNFEWQDSTLNIRSNNEGANVSINGDWKGRTDGARDFKLQPGTYKVEAYAPGFKPQTQTVVVVGGRDANLTFNLEREVVAAPEPKPTEVVPASTPVSSSTINSSTTANAPRAVPRSSIRALVIGIGTYRDKNIRKLEFSESDANKFFEALTDPKIGNIPKENITMLIGSNATQNTIQSTGLTQRT